AQVVEIPAVALLRYERDEAVSVLASLNHAFLVGTRWKLDGPSAARMIRDTGQPVRVDDYSELEGAIAAKVREAGIRSTVGVPISVDGAVWGLITVGTRHAERLPVGLETRLSDFVAVVAPAISSSEARGGRERLAEEQAALRRVATLVAEGA